MSYLSMCRCTQKIAHTMLSTISPQITSCVVGIHLYMEDSLASVCKYFRTTFGHPAKVLMSAMIALCIQMVFG